MFVIWICKQNQTCVRVSYLYAVMPSLCHLPRQLSQAGLSTRHLTTITLYMLVSLLQVKVQPLMVIWIISLLKCFFVAAAQAGTAQGAAVALPVAGHAAMAAPIVDQDASVAGATQGEVWKHIVIFFAVFLQTILCFCQCLLLSDWLTDWLLCLHCDLCSSCL